MLSRIGQKGKENPGHASSANRNNCVNLTVGGNTSAQNSGRQIDGIKSEIITLNQYPRPFVSKTALLRPVLRGRYGDAAADNLILHRIESLDNQVFEGSFPPSIWR